MTNEQDFKTIALDEKDFSDLLSGKIITKGDTMILLKDIGYHVMFSMVSKKFEEFYTNIQEDKKSGNG